MSATANPPARPAEGQPTAALDRAEGIELLGDLHGSGYKDGAALVRRADGQVVQLGTLMYALLENLDGRRSLGELAAAMSEQTGRRFDEKHVHRLAEKLAQQGLLAGTEHVAPPRRNPLLALRFKVLVTNPKVTRILTAPFMFLFFPVLVVPVVVCFAAVFWFVLLHKGVSGATAEAFQKPTLLLLVFALAIASAGFHELGHAAACRYGGATPGGMGMGLYMVWPAFYTDVTDAYRLPRGARLRVDLGGIYFNAVVAVATMGVWLLWHVDALLLLIALQFLIMVKNLSPVIRSDGYHVLADATGIPDLYAHIGPTLRRLIPGRRREPSALTGRARLLVTLWVLIVVPVLLSMMIGAVLLLPRLATSAWDSGHTIATTLPHDAEHGKVVGFLSSLLRLVALFLPVFGSILVSQRVLRMLARKAMAWSAGRPARRTAVVAVAAATACGAAWAWWPAGQYQAVHPTDSGTLGGATQLVSARIDPSHAAAAAPAPVHLAPGRHFAVAMIPVGGATKKHPALYLISSSNGDPAVAILSDSAPDPASTGTTPGPTTDASAFPFTLPTSSSSSSTGSQPTTTTTKGGVTYDVAYGLVIVSGGAPVNAKNTAVAYATCNGCTTVAVSFQLVLIVGESKVIAPINAAEAMNKNCPACVTVAIADQMVVTLTAQPSQQLVAKLDAALQQLNAISALGANGSPAAVAAQVAAVQQEITDELNGSGLLAKPIETGTSTTSTQTTPAQTTSTQTTTSATSTTPAQTTTTGSTTPSTTTPTTTSSTTTPTTTEQTTTTDETTTDTTPTTTDETTTDTTTTTSSGG